MRLQNSAITTHARLDPAWIHADDPRTLISLFVLPLSIPHLAGLVIQERRVRGQDHYSQNPLLLQIKALMHRQHIQRMLANAVHRALAPNIANRQSRTSQSTRHIHNQAPLLQEPLQRLDHLRRADHIDADFLQQRLRVDVEGKLVGDRVCGGVVEEVVEFRIGTKGFGDLGLEARDGGEGGGVAFEDVDGGVGFGHCLEVVVCAGGEGAGAGEDGVGLVGGDLADELEAEAAVGSWGRVLVWCTNEVDCR